MLLGQPGALCSNDAKGCYNRILHPIAALCMKHQKVPNSAIICMFYTLQDLEHNICTAYGDSSTTYGGPIWTLPLQGIGQGNGVNPILWAIISSPVLDDVLCEAGFGTFFKTAITHSTIEYVGFSFVDDTDQVQTGSYPGETSVSIAARMQEVMDTWEGGLRAMGGALDPIKSYWYLIYFIWEDGKWRFTQKDEIEADLYLPDHTLKWLEVSHAAETLGVYQCPDGNMDAQMQKMEQMTKT